MALQSVIQRSFAAGELAPALHARADLARYATGARTCKNFFVRKEGGVSNRAGLRFVEEVKVSADEAFLMRYVSESIGQSVLIEVGDGYLRFFLNGEAVTVSGVTPWNGSDDYSIGDIVSDGGVNYYCVADNSGEQPPDTDFWYAMPSGNLLELPHGFEDHQFNWTQSGRTIALTHGEAHPQELIYQSLTRWIIRDIDTGPWALPPENGSGTAGAVGLRTFRYVVTAARAETYEETEASDPIEILACAEPTADTPNVLAWDPIVGVAEYYVYCDPYDNGVYGFIGTAADPAFNDTGFVADFSETPPVVRVLFDSELEYPHISGGFEQRRVFGQTGNNPDQIDLSRVGFPSNFALSSPLQDDDALRFRFAGGNNHAVRWFADVDRLIVGTASGVWVVKGAGDGPLIPNGILARQQVYAGAHDKKPVVIGKAILYLQARGKLIREVQFEAGQSTLLGGRDLTVYSSHLFEPTTFARIDFAETPHSMLWCVRNDGVLLAMTYLPDEDLQGWSRHETQNGAFEDVCVVPEEDGDRVYVIVRRTIESETVRYIERLEPRTIGEDSFDEDAFFVDCGLSYSGSPANHFSNLDHLEGQVVAVVADGAVIFNGDPSAANAGDFTVTGGEITLEADYENVHIGLPIRYADLETLDLDVQGSDVRDKRKVVNSVVVLVDRSSRGFQVGPDAANLKQASLPSWDGTADEFTGPIEVAVPGKFTTAGRLLIRQTEPLPITILGVIPNVELGG